MNVKKYILVLVVAMPFSIYGQVTNHGKMAIASNAEMIISGDFSNNSKAELINDGELTLLADFTNNGAFSFSDPNLESRLLLAGEKTQHITGNSLIEVNYLTLKNAANNAFILDADLNIENQATFSEGVLNNETSDRPVVFGPRSSHVQASSDSFVSGAVTKLGDTAFEFPVGLNRQYRSVELESPDSSSDAFSVQHHRGNSTFLYSHSKKEGNIELIGTREYWSINKLKGRNFVRITFTWNPLLTSSSILQNPELMRIVRWDSNKELWVDEGGVVDTTNKKITTLLPASGSGIFALARGAGELILPGDVTVYNYLSPNDNSANDFFWIKGIERFPNNQLTVYNRWGSEVYRAKGYNETDQVFRGFSNGGSTFSKGEGLPSGTYFYVLEYEYEHENDGTVQYQRTAGYLYINQN
jgi:gliding motility-associated-like protein